MSNRCISGGNFVKSFLPLDSLLVNISTLIVTSHNMCSGGEREKSVSSGNDVTVSVTITIDVTIIISPTNNSIETCQMMKVASGI